MNDLALLASSETVGVARDWDDFVRLRASTDAIVAAQQQQQQSPGSGPGSGLASGPGSNEAARLDEFNAWLRREKYPLQTAPIEIRTGLAEGAGAVASKDLKAGDLIAQVPRRLMLAGAHLRATPWDDPIVRAAPSLRLALAVWWETRQPSSFWRPYLGAAAVCTQPEADLLPSSFNTPLFYPVDVLELLKGSPTQWEVVRYHKNVVRQYVYILDRLRALKLPLADQFSLASFLRATSVVMTRQNRIPTDGADGAETDMALVPVWDMCNHASDGPITSFFNVETQCLEAAAMRDFAAGEQVYIFYGPRSNADFVLYSGFLPARNPTDALKMRFALAPAAAGASQRAELLRRWGLPPARVYDVAEPIKTGARCRPLRTFVRIFVLGADALDAALAAGPTGGDEASFGEQNEVDMWRYLHTRFALVLRSYATTVEEDERLLQTSDLAPAARTLVQLRRSEKLLLQRIIAELAG